MSDEKKKIMIKKGRQKLKGRNQILAPGYELKSKKRSKYRNKKVECDGLKFDSIAEQKYYLILKERLAAGMIDSFICQPRYLLEKAFTDVGGKKRRKVEYIADFEVHHPNGIIEVVDVKGRETQVFKLKMKKFLSKYPEFKFVLVDVKMREKVISGGKNGY